MGEWRIIGGLGGGDGMEVPALGPSRQLFIIYRTSE